MHVDFEVLTTAKMTVISFHSVFRLRGCEITEQELTLISSEVQNLIEYLARVWLVMPSSKTIFVKFSC